MIIQDDRTEEQRAALKWLVVGTDSFMSGWGQAEGGQSFAAWATDDGHLNEVESFVRQRKDMKRIRIVFADTYKPKGDGHLHIYVYKKFSQL